MNTASSRRRSRPPFFAARSRSEGPRGGSNRAPRGAASYVIKGSVLALARRRANPFRHRDLCIGIIGGHLHPQIADTPACSKCMGVARGTSRAPRVVGVAHEVEDTPELLAGPRGRPGSRPGREFGVVGKRRRSPPGVVVFKLRTPPRWLCKCWVSPGRQTATMEGSYG